MYIKWTNSHTSHAGALDAVALADEIIALDPKSVRVHVAKSIGQAKCGDAYAALGDAQKSIQCYEASHQGFQAVAGRAELDRKQEAEMKRVAGLVERASSAR